MIATGGNLTTSECSKFVFGQAPLGGRGNNAPQTLAGLRGFTSKGRGEEGKGSGKERKGRDPLTQIPGSAPELD